MPVLRVEALDASALFEEPPPAVSPHPVRAVRPALARYLEAGARAERRAPTLCVEVVLHAGPLAPAEEDRVRRDLERYFAEERAFAELELRVNRTEGWGSFRFGAPLVLVALLVAGALYLELGDQLGTSLVAFFTALVYLVFITVVWVLLWDPTEKLLFDAYFLRARAIALGKLARATIRFTHAAPMAR